MDQDQGRPHTPVTCVKCGNGALNSEPRVASLLASEEQQRNIRGRTTSGFRASSGATLETSNDGVCCVAALVSLRAGPRDGKVFSWRPNSHTHRSGTRAATLRAATAKEAILLLLQFHGDGWHLLV